MTTPNGPRASDPIDGPVRQLLWRLRARLVTPPQEQRTQADLDRLIAAAREQAHEAPSAGASSRPTLDGGVASRPDHPLRAGGPSVDGPGDELAAARNRRRWLPADGVGRVAAALLLVAMATGVAGMRDASVSLQAFLGRGEAPSVADSDDELTPDRPVQPSEDEGEPDGTGGDDEAPAPSDSPALADGPRGADGSDAADDAADSDNTEADDDTPVEDTDQESDADASEDAESSSNPPSTGRGVEDIQDVEEAPLPDTGDEVLAAPAPSDDVSGFGGPRPCTADDLADCLSDDEQDGSDTDGSGDGGDGLTATEDGDAEGSGDGDTGSAEELAARRFGGTDSDVEAQSTDTDAVGEDDSDSSTDDGTATADDGSAES